MAQKVNTLKQHDGKAQLEAHKKAKQEHAQCYATSNHRRAPCERCKFLCAFFMRHVPVFDVQCKRSKVKKIFSVSCIHKSKRGRVESNLREFMSGFLMNLWHISEY